MEGGKDKTTILDQHCPLASSGSETSFVSNLLALVLSVGTTILFRVWPA